MRARARLPASMSIIGKVNPAVLPVPVCATPNTSRPCSTIGIACSWIGVGCRYPISAIAFRIGSDRPKSANTARSGSRSAGHSSTMPAMPPPTCMLSDRSDSPSSSAGANTTCGSCTGAIVSGSATARSATGSGTGSGAVSGATSTGSGSMRGATSIIATPPSTVESVSDCAGWSAGAGIVSVNKWFRSLDMTPAGQRVPAVCAVMARARIPAPPGGISATNAQKSRNSLPGRGATLSRAMRRVRAGAII